MDLVDKIRELAARVPKQREHIETEEATKTALVMPFINALGYNVFDPTEVVPEFTADVGTKKGEKVDYAILKDGKPIILFEVKSCGANLSKEHASQLYRYFSVTEARFGILTDGVIYHFHSDLEAPNKMDSTPFFVFNLLDFDDNIVSELKKFTNSAFDVESIVSKAGELKYTRQIIELISKEFSDPSEAFVRHFAKEVYSRRFTQPVLDEFTEITRKAFRAFVSRRVEDRLKSALNAETLAEPAVAVSPEETEQPIEEIESTDNRIETTQEELDGYYVVKSILRETVDPGRIVMRDVRSYCGILLDDNNRKPICRLRFNTSQKHIGLINEDKSEETVSIERIDDIYQYAERLRATVMRYDTQ
ncbi:MAG: type I restriction enzyme HsdR N-terminal domain-containing protein [Anaerolineae bacterium]|nr:type I restriction enzyme HsdR N-terminal domain-containing protein [Anaerolineae bacterium]